MQILSIVLLVFIFQVSIILTSKIENRLQGVYYIQNLPHQDHSITYLHLYSKSKNAIKYNTRQKIQSIDYDRSIQFIIPHYDGKQKVIIINKDIDYDWFYLIWSTFGLAIILVVTPKFNKKPRIQHKNQQIQSLQKGQQTQLEQRNDQIKFGHQSP